MVLGLAIGMSAVALSQAGWKPTFGVAIGGVRVESVDADSVAATGQLKAGDRITRWMGQPISDIAGLRLALSKVAPGAVCHLEVWRLGETPATPSLLRLQFHFPDSFGEGNGAQIGVTPLSGVCVTTVQKNSVAAASGLIAGDIIVGWNGQEVSSFEALRENVSRCRPGSKVELDIIRGGKRQTLDAAYPGQTQGTDSNRRRSGRVDTHGTPRLFEAHGASSPFSGLRAFSEIDSVSEDLKRAIEQLQGIKEGDNHQWNSAMATLKNVSKRIDEMASSLGGLQKMFGDLVDRGSFFGGIESPRVEFERIEIKPDAEPSEIPDPEVVPFMEELEDRLHDLLQEGIDPSEIEEIIRNEFPNVQLEIRSGDRNEAEAEELHWSHRRAVEAEKQAEEARRRAEKALVETARELKELKEKKELKELKEKRELEDKAREVKEAQKLKEKKEQSLQAVARTLARHRDLLAGHEARMSDLRKRIESATDLERAEIEKAMADARQATATLRSNLEKLTLVLKEMKESLKKN